MCCASHGTAQNTAPKARVPLRVLVHGEQTATEDYFTTAIERAADWRVGTLKLDAQMDCYRVVNSDGDALSGLTVDRYADTLSVEVHSLGIYQRLPQILAALHSRLGTRREVVNVDDHIARIEGINVRRAPEAPPKQVRVREHGVRYEVDFTKGHKTGFFCDQRENRLLFSKLVRDRRVLDVCCYTGGFAVTAATLGQPAEVTAVDLDEEAIAQARRNGNLNQQNRIRWIHADGFGWMRQMHQNGARWDAVVLDPPKLVQGDEEDQRLGWQKYEDINRELQNIPIPASEAEFSMRVEQYDLTVKRLYKAKTRIMITTGIVWLIASAGVTFGFFRLIPRD